MSTGMEERHYPDCDSSLKPCVGTIFKNLEDGIKFYKEYGQACGFDTRRGSQRTTRGDFIIKKWVLCNREGVKNAAKVDVPEKNADEVDVLEKDAAEVDDNETHDTTDYEEDSDCVDEQVSKKKKRRRVSRRLGCKARIVLKYAGNIGYIVSEFTEYHSHALVPLVHRNFLDANREINPGHQSFILNCARANIGPMKSFRLFKEVVKGYSNIGCTSVDFKNFSRDLKAFAVGVDAQMLLDKFFKRKERNPGFFFEYDVNENDQLTRLFWADHHCRRNYACFGDVVSFDATYSTNRYNMVFTPFTGKDNHGKCINFGAALLAKEDVESYSWVFEQFKKCMGHSPSMIITDQDPAIKIAIPKVFPKARHRLCMWHIMQKLPKKLPALKDDDVFKRKLMAIVWHGSLDPNEFEDNWVKLMSEYGLEGNKWLNKIYRIREDWIPAYFRDFPMSGLFRTTSMSESENSFFDKNLNPRSNLVEFSMLYDAAVDHQKENFDKLNNADILSSPILLTPLSFEAHAGKIYTTKIFKEVQEDIMSAIYNCHIINITVEPGSRTYDIGASDSTTHKVVHNEVDHTFTCSCKKFIRFGLLCPHIFCRFKDMKIAAIPEKYILERWTKLPDLNPIRKIDDIVLVECAKNDKRHTVINNVFSEFYTCIGLFENSDEKMAKFLSVIREQKVLISDAEEQSNDPSSRATAFENHYGTSLPENVSVHPPPQINTKGSGSRLVSRQAAAIVRENKPKRTCSICGEKGRHDARTCPSKPKITQDGSAAE